MKKFTLLLLCFFTFGFVHAESSFYVGEGGENHTIMFAESTLENGFFDKSDIWITDKIKANLISCSYFPLLLRQLRKPKRLSFRENGCFERP